MKNQMNTFDGEREKKKIERDRERVKLSGTRTNIIFLI